MLTLDGIVDGGQTLAGHWLRDPLFEALLGPGLHWASLNVFVSAAGHESLRSCRHPFFRETVDEGLSPANVRATGHLLVRDCTVNSVPAFILRTEHPGAAYAGPSRPVATRMPQPNTMFEVIAPWIDGIPYGSKVTFAFDPDPSKLRKVPVPLSP